MSFLGENILSSVRFAVHRIILRDENSFGWSSRFILRGHKQEDVSKYDEYGSVTADAEFVGSKWEMTNPEL